MPTRTNLFLEQLSASERGAINPHLTEGDHHQNEVLYDTYEEVTKVYFALDAVVSLVVPLSTGEVVETAMVGRDGIIGTTAAIDGKISVSRAVVEIGGTCLSCTVKAFKPILNEHERFRSLVGAHEQALFAQAQQSAACNATHVIESRLARWLLRASDLSGSTELPLTQEHLAQVLGVRRTSVTLVASTLQKAGMISYKRGHIHLHDISGLQETACECYQAVKMNYDALFHPSNR